MIATHTLPLASPGMTHVCPCKDLQQLGHHIDLRVKTGAGAIRALTTQLPTLHQRLSDGQYQVRVAGRDAGEAELSSCLDEPLTNNAVIHTVPRLVGAKSGGMFQAMSGAALIATVIQIPGISIAFGDILFLMGAVITLGGIAQMPAPKAKTPRAQTTDGDRQSTYFSSLDNMVAQSDVLPALHGRIHVGPRAIPQEVSTADEGDGSQVVIIGRQHYFTHVLTNSISISSTDDYFIDQLYGQSDFILRDYRFNRI